MTTSNGKHLEDISHAHNVSSMYNLISSAKYGNDLSVGFDGSRDRRQQKLTSNKKVKDKYHARILLKDVFGFVECMEKATYGLGYKLTPTRKKDDAVIDKTMGLAAARIQIHHIHWFVPQYTPSIQQQGNLSKQILSKTHTELQYVERSVFKKEINNQNLWKFEQGSHESMNVPIWITFGFQQRDRQDSQNLNNDTFCRLAVVSARCVISTENYPYSSIIFILMMMIIGRVMLKLRKFLKQ